MSGEATGWLKEILSRGGWCTSPHCTTCGALEFRRAVWLEAARQAGVDVTSRFGRRDRSLAFLEMMSAVEREATVRAVVAGLRGLPSELVATEGFRTIMIDLHPPLLLHGVPMSLGEELAGTPAGEALARMEAHAAAVWAARARRAEYESPEAVEERRRRKRAKRARAHAARQARGRRRNAERLALLEALGHLPVSERLSRFASDPAINLDAISPDLVPTKEHEIADLDRETAVALIARIGGRRKEWGRLRRMLERRFHASPG